MQGPLHRLAQRQVERHLGGMLTLPPPWWSFVRAVSDAYEQADADRSIIERSLELSSKELVTANARMRAVVQALPDLMYRLDGDGKILECRVADGSLMMVSPKEIVGRTIQSVVPPDVAKRFSWALSRVTVGVRLTSFEYKVRATDAPVRHFEARLVPMESGQVLALVRDITERALAAEALRENEARTRAIINSTAEGIWGLDGSGRITFANTSTARLLGLEIGDLVGRFHHTVFHHTHVDGCTPYPDGECPIHACLRDGQVRSVDSEVFWRADGSSFPVEYTVAPVLEGGNVTAVVVTFADVTEKRALETRLLTAQKLEGIGLLAAGIAHEINTPTQYVQDNTQFLHEAFRDITALLLSIQETIGTRDDASADAIRKILATQDIEFFLEEVPRAVQHSLEGLERVSAIVKAMKEFSHPGTGRKRSVDLNHAVRNTFTVCRNEWKYVAELELDLDEDLPPVACHLDELNQVVLNIVINAAHAIAEKLGGDATELGRIRVTTRRDGEWVDVRIADTGTGIPEHARNRVFEPFFTTKGIGRGTGQGLAIAHSIVTDKHGGTLDFETKVGEGTTFIIRLPIGSVAEQEDDPVFVVSGAEV
jgi:PAS domain S-box-containing protein